MKKYFPSLIIQFLKKLKPSQVQLPPPSPVISFNIKISLKSKYFFQTPPLLTPLEHIAIRQGWRIMIWRWQLTTNNVDLYSIKTPLTMVTDMTYRHTTLAGSWHSSSCEPRSNISYLLFQIREGRWGGWLPNKVQTPQKNKSPRKSPFLTRISPFALPNLTETLG